MKNIIRPYFLTVTSSFIKVVPVILIDICLNQILNTPFFSQRKKEAVDRNIDAVNLDTEPLARLTLVGLRLLFKLWSSKDRTAIDSSAIGKAQIAWLL